MDKKISFRKSLLSSAIIATTIQTLSATAQAATCPPPNASGNVHVSVGEFCEGGITADAGSGPINDIGIQGYVKGDVLVEDGISDFWMSAGELDGSFINNDVMRDVNISNGSTVFSDIRNNGDMRFLTVDGGPGASTVIHGDIVNDGNIARVHITGSQTQVRGSVISSAMGTINQSWLIDNGATIEGDVTNHGDMNEIWVNNAHIGGNLTNTGEGDSVVITDGASVGGTFNNEGNVFGVGVLDGSTVTGDLINSGDVFVLTAVDGSSVSGSMVNNGGAVVVDVRGGSHIAGDLINHGFVDGATTVNESSVTGQVLNGADGYTNDLSVVNGASVGSIANEGLTRFLWVESSDVGSDVVNDGSIDGILQVTDGSTIGRDLINNGDITPGTEPFFGAVDGLSGFAGIEVTNASTVVGDLVNNGTIILDYAPEPLPDGFTPESPMQGVSIAGISVNNGSHGGRIVNSGSITVTTGQEHDGPEARDGAQVNGIEVVNGATTGDVINEGVITADTFGILIDGEGNDGVTVEGDVINTAVGSITSKDNGIYVRNAEVTGTVQNDGLVHSIDDNAIDIENSVIGSLINNGILTSKYWYDGVDIDDTTILGDVKNLGDGVINGEDAFDIIDSSIGGTLANLGTINANDNGIELDNTDIGENLQNSGVINAGDSGIVFRGVSETIDGEVVTDAATIGGDFTHVGDIVAGVDGVVMEHADIAGVFDSAGDITADGSGILLSDVNIGGDFINRGDISSGGEGIRIVDASIGGGFLNEGNISTDGENAINIEGHTQIGGDIVNSGDLDGYQGIRLNAEATLEDGQLAGEESITVAGGLLNTGDIIADDHAIRLNGVDLGGDLINHGNLTDAGSNGIDLHNVIIRGSVGNTGTIASSDNEGIDIDYALITGDVINTGDITADSDPIIIEDSHVHGNVINDGTLVARENDALEFDNAWIGGSVINNGDLHAGDYGIEIDNDDDGSIAMVIEGNLENHGNIYSIPSEYVTGDGSSAIDIDGLDLKGHFINTGDLHAVNDGFDVGNTTIGRNWFNNGDITAGINGLDVQGSRIWHPEEETPSGITPGYYILNPVTIGGALVNNGDITAGKTGIELELVNVGANGVTVGGQANLVNSGDIVALDGSAIDLRAVNVAGDFINGGDLVAQKIISTEPSAEENKSYHRGISLTPHVYAQGEDSETQVTSVINGYFYNSGTISSVDEGIYIQNTDIGGYFENLGDITSASRDAVVLSDVTIGQHFINQGDLTAGAEVPFGGSGIIASNVTIGGHVESTGDIISNDVSIFFNETSIGGHFLNTGDLSSSSDSGILFLGNNTIAEGFQNDGDITANDYGIALLGDKSYDSVDGQLIVNDVMTVGGDFINRGDVSTEIEAIKVRDADIDGSLVNEGDLVSVDNVTLSISGAVSIGGDVINTGDITSNNFSGIRLESDNARIEDGQLIADKLITVGGGLQNSGDISALFNGIELDGVALGDSLVNTGDITVQDGSAILVNDSVIEGGVINHGDLVVSGAADDGPFYSGGDGITIENSIVRGDVFNNGRIDSAGIEGIAVDGSTITGSLLNTVDGEIVARSDAFMIENSTIQGDFINDAHLVASEHDGIDFNDTTITGDWINRGNIVAGDTAIEIDGRSDRDDGVMFIGGNLLNYGDLTTRALETSSFSPDNGFDVEYLELSGNFENHGSIDSQDDAIFIEDSLIGGNLVNTGAISSGKKGFEVEGHRDSDREDGVASVNTVYTEIGGQFYNEGVVQAGDTGIDWELVKADGGFENHGNINSLSDSGIALVASEVGSDFINTGNISALGNSQYVVGDSYYSEHGVNLADGEVTLEAQGVDAGGQGWLRVRNESDQYQELVINEADGGFVSQWLHIAPGSEALVNVGSVDGTENYRLSVIDNPFSVNDGEVIASAPVDAVSGFTPQFNLNEQTHQGIRLVNKVYQENSELAPEDLRTSIAGNMLNGGDIQSRDQSIFMENVSVGGTVQSTGNLTSERATGIEVVAGTIGGDFINTGDITAGQSDTYRTGDSYRIGGEPVPDGSIVFNALGTDAAGNAWFEVRNETNDSYGFDLKEEGGDFSTGNFNVDSGETLRFNAGVVTGDLALSYDGLTASADLSVFEPEPIIARGISLVDTPIAGAFHNEGTITAKDEGIYLKNVSVGGGFTNLGNITSDNETGIAFAQNVTMGGDFINRGDITAARRGIELLGDVTIAADGQQVINSLVSVDGNFVNSGNMVVNNNGIRLVDATIGGNFENTGNITTVKPGPNYALNFYGSTHIGGDIVNAGDLFGSKGIRVVGESSLNNEGVLVDGETVTVAGDLINHGDIDARNDAIRMTGVELGGSVINTGYITTDTSNTLDMDHVIVGGNIENHGTIENHGGFDAVMLDNAIVQGSIINNGTIIAHGTRGIEVDDTLIEGSVINTEDGLISADNEGIDLSKVHIYGSVVNEGEIVSGSEAIHLDNFVVDGNIGNTGSINTASEGVELRGNYSEHSVVKGNLFNTGTIVTAANQWSSSNGDAGIAVDYVDIHGSFINTGTISTDDDEGITMEDFSIGGDFISGDGSEGSGTITAARYEGIELEGSRRWHSSQETADGVVPGYYTTEYSDIGGRFINNGDITSHRAAIDLELIRIGTNGDLADGSANFENHGNLTAADDHTIDIRGSMVAGDFINTGELSASKAPFYEESDFYYQDGASTTPDGSITFTAMGVDEYGNGWVKVSNEGASATNTLITKDDETVREIYVQPGSTVFVNTGTATASNNITLSAFDDGHTPIEGELGVVTLDLADNFTPTHLISANDFQRGISLTAKEYINDDSSTHVIRTQIGGSVGNSGAISAIDEGIYLNQVDVGGDFINEGAITSAENSAIDISATSIAGNLINSGDLRADTIHTSREGDNYIRDWSGTTSGDGQMVVESLGVDENGDHWYAVRNEGTGYQHVEMADASGEFTTHDFGVHPGQERIVNAGEISEDVTISQPWGGGALDVASVNNSPFTPEVQDQNGLRLVDSQVGGGMLNTGNISSVDQSILVENSSVGGVLVNDGDLVSSTSSGIELIENSVVNGDLINNGDIDAALEGIYVADSFVDGTLVNTGDLDTGEGGVIVVDSEINGGVYNTGNIDSSLYSGLYVGYSQLDGDVINTGDINFGPDDVGLWLDEVEGVGDFINTGDITAGNIGSEHGWSVAMAANHTQMNGIVANTGDLKALDAGISLYDVSGIQGLFNTGTVNTSNWDAVRAVNSTINGNVVNAHDAGIHGGRHGLLLDSINGTINHVANQGAISGDYIGLRVINSTVEGSVVNESGASIAGGDHALLLEGVTGVDHVLNEGTVDGGEYGLRVYDSEVNGLFLNGADGTIRGGEYGASLEYVTGLDHVVNQGTIESEQGIALQLVNTDVAGDIVNTGTVSAGGHGLWLWNVSADNVVNSGTIEAGTFTQPGDGDGEGRAYGTGISLIGDFEEGDVLTGSVVNTATGTITAEDNGIFISRISAQSLENQGVIESEGYGISALGSDFTGNIYNGGTLTAGTEEGLELLGVTVSKQDGEAAAGTGHVINGVNAVLSAGKTGMLLSNSDIAGNVVNAGTLEAGLDGIFLTETNIGGVVVNTGTLTAGRAGINIEGERVRPPLPEAPETGGSVTNTGDLSSGGSAGIMIDPAEIQGGFVNTGALDHLGADGDYLTTALDTVDVPDFSDLHHYQPDTSRLPGATNPELDGDNEDFSNLAQQVGNTGTINAGTVGIRVVNGALSGDVYNAAGATITAGSTGILLDNVEGADRLLNLGTIDAGEDGMVVYGGSLNGNVLNSGEITTAGLANGLTVAIGLVDVDGVDHVINTGTITAGTSGSIENKALGIGLNGVEMDGEVSNYGSINTNGYAIAIDHVDGITNVINQGDITTQARGVYVVNSDLAGHVVNNGTISSRNSAVYLENVTAGHVENNDNITVSEGHGIKLDDVVLSGNVANRGELTAGHHGISLDTVTTGGSVVNSGAITAGTDKQEGNGIEIDNSTLAGVVGNVTDGEILSTDGAHGIVVTGTQGITNVFNQGVIDAGGKGISVTGSEVRGIVSNSKDITAGDAGIELKDNTGFVGGLVNSGNIDAGNAVVADGIYASGLTLAGAVQNAGTIEASGSGVLLENNEGSVIGLSNIGNIKAGVNGLVAINTDVNGDVFNTGTIITDGVVSETPTAALGLVNVNGVEDFINEGTINAGQTAGEGNLAVGMGAQNVRMDGVIVNTGDITSNSYGMAVENVQGAKGVSNNGSLDTQARGLYVKDTDIAGQLQNTGDIQSRFSGIYTDGSSATTLLNTDGITVSEGHGIKVIDTAIAGDVLNAGQVKAGHHGISLDDATIDGGLFNTGSIIAGEFNAEGNGIEAFDSTINGAVQNQGTIVAGGSGVVLENINGVVDNLYNSGSIEAKGGDGIRASGVTLEGIVRNDSTINATGSGIVLDNVNGATGLVNNGTVAAGSDGLSASNGSINGDVQNLAGKKITAGDSGIVLNNITGVGNLINSGEITAENGDGIVFSGTMAGQVGNNTDASIIGADNGIVLAGVDGITDLLNQGSITATNGTAISVTDSSINGLVSNSGTLNGGGAGLVLDNIEGDITAVQNTGTILANGDGIRIAGAAVSGNLTNTSTITANVGGNGIVLQNTSLQGVIQNTNVISAAGIAIDISADSNEISVGGLFNSGTITAEGGPAIKVAGASIGQVTNTGTINGGVVTADSGAPTTQALRDLSGNPIAFDFRDVGSPVTIVNGTDSAGNTGIINGDIFGGDLAGDLLILSSGQLNGDVYDIEDINITGTITLDNNIFSFNNSSTLTVEETGTLAMGMGNTVRGESDFVHRGSLTADVNINERSYDEAIVDVEGEAVLEEGSSFTLSIVDQDIRNIDTTDGGANMVIVRAQEGVTNNGVSVAFGADSQSILVDIAGYDSADSIESGATISVADLGALASAGGADANASNALAALQGIDSAGLVELIESNPELYEDLWNGSEASLADLAEQLVASPENGIAAGQAAQAEAVNTILTRIAELRTGASGISTGDSGTSAGDYIRPDSLWIRAIYSDGEQDATRTSNGDFNSYALRSKGFTIGADKDVSDTLTVGAGVTVATSTANEKGSSQYKANSETDTYLGSLYAGWRDQDYFVDASVNVGTGKTDLKGADWEADYDSSQLGISVLGGKSFLFNNNDSLVEPRVGFNYTRLETDDYSYQSNGERVTVSSQNLETLEVGAGVRFITGIEVGDGLLLPEASVMAWHDFKGDEVKANVEFETGGGSFTYFGPEAVKTRYQAGVGAEYLMDNNFTVSVNYEHNWQSGFKADTWVAKLRYDF